MARIIFNTLNKARLFEHLEVVFRPLTQSLGFEKLIVFLEILHALIKLDLDAVKGLFELILWSSVVGVREDMDAVRLFAGLSGQRVNNAHGLQSIEAKFKPVSPFSARWKEVDRVTHDTEIAALESKVVAVVLHGNEVDKEVLLRKLLIRQPHVSVCNSLQGGFGEFGF